MSVTVTAPGDVIQRQGRIEPTVSVWQRQQQCRNVTINSGCYATMPMRLCHNVLDSGLSSLQPSKFDKSSSPRGSFHAKWKPASSVADQLQYERH